MRFNKYIEEMLLLARDRHKDNQGTGRWGDNPCPLCVADEDAHWFYHKEALGLEDSDRPERMPGPHCQFCPMISIIKRSVNIQVLMDDCVAIGKYALERWENRLEEIWTGSKSL